MAFIAAILMAVACATTASLLMAMAWGHLTTGVAALSLCAGILLGGWVFSCSRRRNLERLTLTPFDWVICFFFLLFCFRQFSWVYYRKDGGLYTLLRHNFGDLPLHLSYIQNFVAGGEFWPKNPFFSWENLHYAFGADLFSALFVKLGVPLLSIIPATGWFWGLLTLAALLFWGRGFALGAFLFSTGIAGYEALISGVLKDYQTELAWRSIPLTLLVPQRGFQYAFPAGLILLWSWRSRFLRNDKEALPTWIEGLLWGTMPLFHLHTFLALSFVFLAWVVCRGKLKEGLPIFLWAVAPATFEVWFLTDAFGRASVIGWKPGWMMENQNPFLFFITNFGFLIPLIFFAIPFALRSEEAEHRWLLFPALILWGVCFFVMFAPWDWDNMKVMVWCALLMFPVFGALIERTLRPRWRAWVYGLLFFSGGVSIYSEHVHTNGGQRIAEAAEVDGVCHALKSLPARGRVATAQSHNHSVSLCGYPMTAGFSGWLWAHGIKAGPVEEKLKRLMQGDPAWRTLARELETRYLFWGHRERDTYKDGTRPWETQAAKVAEGEWGAIYDLESVAPDGPSHSMEPVP